MGEPYMTHEEVFPSHVPISASFPGLQRRVVRAAVALRRVQKMLSATELELLADFFDWQMATGPELVFSPQVALEYLSWLLCSHADLVYGSRSLIGPAALHSLKDAIQGLFHAAGGVDLEKNHRLSQRFERIQQALEELWETPEETVIQALEQFKLDASYALQLPNDAFSQPQDSQSQDAQKEISISLDSLNDTRVQQPSEAAVPRDVAQEDVIHEKIASTQPQAPKAKEAPAPIQPGIEPLSQPVSQPVQTRPSRIEVPATQSSGIQSPVHTHKEVPVQSEEPPTQLVPSRKKTPSNVPSIVPIPQETSQLIAPPHQGSSDVARAEYDATLREANNAVNFLGDHMGVFYNIDQNMGVLHSVHNMLADEMNNISAFDPEQMMQLINDTEQYQERFAKLAGEIDGLVGMIQDVPEKCLSRVDEVEKVTKMLMEYLDRRVNDLHDDLVHSKEQLAVLRPLQERLAVQDDVLKKLLPKLDYRFSGYKELLDRFNGDLVTISERTVEVRTQSNNTATKVKSLETLIDSLKRDVDQVRETSGIESIKKRLQKVQKQADENEYKIATELDALKSENKSLKGTVSELKQKMQDQETRFNSKLARLESLIMAQAAASRSQSSQEKDDSASPLASSTQRESIPTHIPVSSRLSFLLNPEIMAAPTASSSRPTTIPADQRDATSRPAEYARPASVTGTTAATTNTATSTLVSRPVGAQVIPSAPAAMIKRTLTTTAQDYPNVMAASRGITNILNNGAKKPLPTGPAATSRTTTPQGKRPSGLSLSQFNVDLKKIKLMGPKKK